MREGSSCCGSPTTLLLCGRKRVGIEEDNRKNDRKKKIKDLKKMGDAAFTYCFFFFLCVCV